MFVNPGYVFIGNTSLGPLNQKNYAIFRQARKNCDIMMYSLCADLGTQKVVFPIVPRRKGSRKNYTCIYGSFANPVLKKNFSPFPYIDNHCCHYITYLDLLTLWFHNKLDSGTSHFFLYITPSLHIECHCGRIWSNGEWQQQTCFLHQRTTLHIH